MTVSNVISGSINEAGDEFFAEITEDVAGKKALLFQKAQLSME